jgi:hypothetical protein
VKIVNELQPEHLAYWADQLEAAPITMKSPAGLEDCNDCSAVLTRNEHGERVVRVAWKPDEIELAHLARGGTIWLSTWGGLPPHMLEVQEP